LLDWAIRFQGQTL